MGKEKFVQVEGTKGRRSQRFFMFPKQAEDILNDVGDLLDAGGEAEGVEINFGNGKRIVFDDLTVEKEYPSEKPNNN